MPTPIDVFAIGGQSNAVGHGTGGPGLPPSVASQWWGGILADVTADSVGGSSGSAWPAFARRWFSITGRRVCFVPCAVNGSSLLPAAATSHGDWSPTGAHFTEMESRVAAALSALGTAGFEPRFHGMLWAQGEAETVALGAATITATEYQTAFEALHDRFEVAFPFSHLFTILTGDRDGVANTHCETVRAIQLSVASSKMNGAVVHTTTKDFVSAGWLASGSNVHWSQAGLDHVGGYVAQAISCRACFVKQWPSLVGALTAGAPAAFPSVTVESVSSDRRLTVSGNILNVTQESNPASPQNLGLNTNGGGVVFGATSKVFFGSGLNFINSGSGVPNGTLVAPVGSVYLRRDGAANTTFWIKESGTGNTGWVAK